MKKISLYTFLVLILSLICFSSCKNDQDNSVVPPAHETLNGVINVTVGGTYGPYINNNVAYTIEHNADGSINVIVPAFELKNTKIGDLYLGSYTIKNITHDGDCYLKDYANDGLQMYFKSPTMEGTYQLLPSHKQNIEVYTWEHETVIINSFQVGNMPFPIVSYFSSNDAK